MKTQHEKALQFQHLHLRQQTFVMPNPWDAGSAKLLENMGFEALASTGAGVAFSLGLPDGQVGRERMMKHLADLVAATDLPVSADLENGFGDDPETVAQTIRLAAAAGVVGGSIEDATGDPGQPLYSLSQAVERVHAAMEAAKGLPFPFLLTARAENFLVGPADLEETLRRLQAYQAVGADVLFAPGLTSQQEIAAVVAAIDRPLNVMMGFPAAKLGLDTLSKIGVRRISLGASLARAALGALRRAGADILERKTFTYAQEAVSGADLNRIFACRPTVELVG